MKLTTEYEIMANKIGIVDRDTFLSNLKKLATVDNNARIVFNQLDKKNNTVIDIPNNISKDKFADTLNIYYNCFNSMSSNSIYHIFIERFNYKKDSKASFTNLKPVEDCLYRAYREDYSKFIKCMHEWMENPGIWGIDFDSNTNTHTINTLKIDIDTNSIPKIPYVPKI